MDKETLDIIEESLRERLNNCCTAIGRVVSYEVHGGANIYTKNVKDVRKKEADKYLKALKQVKSCRKNLESPGV